MAVRVSAQGTSWATPGPRQRFAVAVAQLGNGTPVVSVMGELNLAAVPGFERTLLDVTEAATGEVIVDLTRCSFLDSRGVRALSRPGSASSAPTDRSRSSLRARS
jgi:hypothetical protein